MKMEGIEWNLNYKLVEGLVISFISPFHSYHPWPEVKYDIEVVEDEELEYPTE